MASITLKTTAGRFGAVAGGFVMAAAIWLGLGGSINAAPPVPDPVTCLPTCAIDGRFLVSAGDDFTTLSAQEIVLGLSFTEAAGPDGNFELFDGDSDDTNWDVLFNCGVGCVTSSASAPQLIVELYADPSGIGGSALVARWTPDAIPDGAEKGTFPTLNNDWSGVTFPHDVAALNGTNYLYALRIRPLSPESNQGWNAFKLRAAGTVLLLADQVVGFIAAMNVPNDLDTIYPSFPDMSISPYDGTWVFKTLLPAGLNDLTVFDGDMDYGAPDCAYNDSDDPDSPNDVVPAFAAGTVAVPEGIAVASPPNNECLSPGDGVQTGSPTEDNLSPAFRRIPTIGAGAGIAYQLKAPGSPQNPNGQIFLNQNPSGNKEWEQFRIQLVEPGDVTNGACPAEGYPADEQKGYLASDCRTTDLPAGVWEIQLDGMDLSNLNFWFFSFKVEPIADVYSIGRLVWHDANEDGVKDPSEDGIPGVAYTVYDGPLPGGTAVRTGFTDANGEFLEAGLPAGSYTVVIDDTNFGAAAPLNGMQSTTGGETQNGIEVGLPTCSDAPGPGCGEPGYAEALFGYFNPPDPTYFIVIDEDSIDNGVLPNNFSAPEVNEHIAAIGLRAVLPRFNGAYIGTELTLFTGETNDHGWFSLQTIPANWVSAGPTTDGLRNFVGMPVGNGLGTGPNPEQRLDKIPNVTPYNEAMLYATVGQTFCAVVFDGSISINTNPLTGSLKGANLGIVAFQVLEVTDNKPGNSSSTLPKVRLVIRDATALCAGPLATPPLQTSAPAKAQATAKKGK